MNPLPPACVAYQTDLLQLLDQRATELPESPHLLECPHCQALRQSALAFVTAPTPPVPAMNPARVELIVADLQRLANAQRRSRRLAWLTSAVLPLLVIASIVGNHLSLSKDRFPSVSAPAVAPPREPSPIIPTPKIEDTFSEAGAALVSVTRQTTEQTLRPAQSLLSWSNPLPMSLETETPLETAAEPLMSLPNSARSSLDPVASGTKRAVNRIFRDLSAWNPAKPKS